MGPEHDERRATADRQPRGSRGDQQKKALQLFRDISNEQGEAFAVNGWGWHCRSPPISLPPPAATQRRWNL
jgi:hypothetical protein